MKFTRALPALALGLLLLAGCGKDNPVASNGGNGTDPAALYAGATGVQTEVQQLPTEFDFATYADGMTAKPDIDATLLGTTTSTQSAGGSLTTDAAIDPGFWWRQIQNHERRLVVDIEEPDTLTKVARVQVIDRLTGTFNIMTKPDTVDGQVIDPKRIQKPLADTSIRKAVFVRKRCLNADGTDDMGDRDVEDGYRDGWSRWRLRAVSGTEITSDNGTREIQSVRIQAGPQVDVTITDPLKLMNLREELLRLPPDAPVDVTVATGDPTDRVVLYAGWGRMRLRKGDDGLFHGRFMTPADFGMRHIAVNALSQGTLFDDVAPYDSKAWGIPFMIAPPPPPPVAQN